MRTALRFLALLLAALAPLPVRAEPASPASPRHWPGDAGKVLASPLHWDGRDLGRFGLVAAGAGLSFFLLDDKLEDHAERTPHSELDDLSEKVRYLGEGPVLVPAFGAAWLYGELAGKGRLKDAALAGAESWLISGFIVGAGKIAVHRYRPKADAEQRRVSEQAFFSTSNLSFPSGHSAAAFSTARVAAWYFVDSPAAPYVCYGLASLVAWSRINDNEHWASDVVVGSAVGYFTAGKVVKLAGARRSSGGTALLPVYGGGPGLTAVHRF